MTALLVALSLLCPEPTFGDPIQMANEALLKKDYKLAIQDFSDAIKQDANSKPALLGRGKAYFFLAMTEKSDKDIGADLDLADHDFQAAMRLYPTDESVYITQFDLLEPIKAYDSSLRVAELGLTKVPNSLNLALRKIKVLRDLKRDADAQTYTDELLAKNNNLARDLRAQILVQAGKTKELIDQLTTQIDKETDDKAKAKLLDRRADAYISANDLGDAKADNDASLKLDSNNPDFHGRKGQILLYQPVDGKDLDEKRANALLFINQAVPEFDIAIKGGSEQFRAMRGECLFSQKRYLEAKDDLVAYMATTDDAADNADRKRRQDMLDACNAFIDMHPENYVNDSASEVRDILRAHWYLRGRYGKAVYDLHLQVWTEGDEYRGQINGTVQQDGRTVSVASHGVNGFVINGSKEIRLSIDFEALKVQESGSDAVSKKPEFNRFHDMVLVKSHGSMPNLQWKSLEFSDTIWVRGTSIDVTKDIE